LVDEFSILVEDLDAIIAQSQKGVPFIERRRAAR
jgi:hypothetical protein